VFKVGLFNPSSDTCVNSLLFSSTQQRLCALALREAGRAQRVRVGRRVGCLAVGLQVK